MGDDALTNLETVQDRYRQTNGEHPMSEVDEAYVREHFSPATDEQLADIAAGRLPLPGYVLTNGTPMVADVSECVAAAGGVEHLHDWFVAFWPDDQETAETEWQSFLSGQYVCLRKVDPVSIRRKTVLVEQAREAVAVLRDNPRDGVAQGALAEAVDGAVGVKGLDSILLPMTGYDRLRFDGPTVRELWVDAVRAEFHNPQPPELPIRTERLTLRRTTIDDAPAMARAWADPSFSQYLLIPPQNQAEVTFETFRRSQPLDPSEPHRRLALVIEHDGTPIGNVVLFFPGVDTSSAEIGWTLSPWASGKGLATEAARALLALAFEHYGVRRVVANLDADNERSAALCERLGMRRETHRLADFWSKGRWTDSYEYAILRSEWEATRV